MRNRNVWLAVSVVSICAFSLLASGCGGGSAGNESISTGASRTESTVPVTPPVIPITTPDRSEITPNPSPTPIITIPIPDRSEVLPTPQPPVIPITSPDRP